MNFCNKCNLSKSCMNQLQLQGNCSIEECELLLISDYSHAEEDIRGYALSEDRYKFIFDLLNSIGVKYLVTAVVKCLPVDFSTRRYRKPTDEEYITCFNNNCINEILACKPNIILLLGQSTVDIVLPGRKVSDYREKTIEINFSGYNCKVLTTYHPNYVLNSENDMFYKRFIEDLVYSCRYGMKDRESGKYITKTITSSQFKRVVDLWCNDTSIEYVSFDTESNGLNPLIKGSKITSFSVAVDDVIGYNIYMYHPEHPEISDDDRKIIIEAARKLLTEKKVVVHHAKHEYRYTKTCWGFTPNITDDTMYMAYILFMSYPGISYGLKYLSGRFISMPPWEEYTTLYSELFKKLHRYKSLDDDRINQLIEDYPSIDLNKEDILRFWTILNDPDYYIKQAESDKSDAFYWMIPSRILERYAGMDAIAPLKLMKVLKPMLEEDEGLFKCYKLLMEAAEVFANIELKGVRIHDIDKWTERYDEEICKALEIIRSFPEVQSFELENNCEYNPNSSKQNADVFFSKFGFPVQGLTGKGEPSTSEGNLVQLIDIYRKIENPTEDDKNKLNFLMYFRRYKKLKKIMSSYLIGLREHIRINDAYDGINCKYMPFFNEELMCMHPQYTLHGTETGRLSSQNPSLHTIPTDSEIKKIIVPHYLGHGGLFVMADYGSAELRVLASVAEKYYGDSHLADSFRRGEDAHKFVASRVFNKPIDEITSLERRFSKSISFAVVYGSAVSSVAENTNRTLEEAQSLFDTFYEMFPGVKRYIESMHNYVSQYGCIRTPMGRIRHLPDGLNPSNRSAYSAALRQSQNSPIQSAASDIAVTAIVEFYRNIRKLGLESKIVGTVHDSIYVDVSPGELIESLELLNHSMKVYPEETLDYLTCPLGVDLEISTNLGDHASLLDHKNNEDGSITLILEGYDYLMYDIIEEMKVAYNIKYNLLGEREYDTGDVDITASKGVISLTTRGKFNMQKYEINLIKKG